MLIVKEAGTHSYHSPLKDYMTLLLSNMVKTIPVALNSKLRPNLVAYNNVKLLTNYLGPVTIHARVPPKLVVTQLAKKFDSLYGSRRFITVFTIPVTDP